MRTISPPFIQPGDTIGITCPAGFISQERIDHAVDTLQRWGYNIVIGDTIGERETYLSGNDAGRTVDLQSMLDNPAIKAIIMGRGGYGTSRIIDNLDFSRFRQNPKWICGFSDITVLHGHIFRNEHIATLHSPMCSAFTPESENGIYIQTLKNLLEGKIDYSIDMQASTYNRSGICTAPLVGGNLALLAHLTGSKSQLCTDGCILFIEDIGEHLYQIDRMLLGLKRSGQLSRLAGLVVGTFTDTEDTQRPFGYNLEEIVMQKVADYHYPVAFGLPVGHGTENMPIMHGSNYTLTVDSQCSTLQHNFSENDAKKSV
jgi:muramoyltetrapeptide carboxypeptidase